MQLNGKDEDSSWFLSLAREKAKASQYSAYMTEAVEAIGDRRNRDLLDLVARCERDFGWSSAAEILNRASAGTYHPRRYSQLQGTQIEPLKYREMIFELMACSGLEPIELDLSTKLMELSSQDSFAKATREFSQTALDSVRSQVAGGDTLFFDTSTAALPMELRTTIEEQQTQGLKHVSIIRSGPKLDLTQVWSTELGRRTLADLGIKGYTTQIADESLLDVIQVSLGPHVPVVGFSADTSITECIGGPANPMYRRLLGAIASQDVKELTFLGSGLSSPTLSFLMRECLQGYEDSRSTLDYGAFLSLLDALIVVRSPDLIQTIADMIKNTEPRISVPAAYTLSNFYHESAVHILIHELCSSRTGDLTKTCSQALQYIHMKTPIAEPIIAQAMKSACLNTAALKRILRSKSWTSPGLEL